MTNQQFPRANVLMSAYACEPGQGSEEGVGWNYVQQIARFHDVWVLTRANNRLAIERARTESLANVHWVYFDLPHWARFWKKGPRGMRLYYYLWQIGTYSLSKRLHAQVRFDFVHQVTFGTYWFVCFLPFLSIPFIWGPVGGGESAPPEFYQTFSWRGKAYERLRDAARYLSEKDPFLQRCARHATLTLAKTPDTAERVRRLGAHSIQIFGESGLNRDELTTLDLPFRQSSPLRFISVGRLLQWKGFHLGLQAFAQFQRAYPTSEYWIVGDGPERQNLSRLAQKLGIADKVRFCGHQPRHQGLQYLAECDVLVHPSLHDSGGWVCLEAMAARRPVLCLDLGGPALQVTNETGVKIAAASPPQAVTDLAAAMLQLASDPGLRQAMGEAARRRVEEQFVWNHKGEQIRSLYDELANAALV